jgi:hypothetical protein
VAQGSKDGAGWPSVFAGVQRVLLSDPAGGGRFVAASVAMSNQAPLGSRPIDPGIDQPMRSLRAKCSMIVRQYSPQNEVTVF